MEARLAGVQAKKYASADLKAKEIKQKQDVFEKKEAESFVFWFKYGK